MSERARRSPIHVEKGRTWKGEVVWVWSCDAHPRHRGYHHTNRWTDQWRRAQGLLPDTHPWLRCMDGAARHWHEHHAVCKCTVTPDPDMALKPRADSRESKDDHQIGHAQ